jgi:enediyne biosynthesis protein E4
MGRRLLGIGSALALIWLVYWGFASWRYSADLARAVREMETGHHGAARDRLARLSARWPGQPVVEFSLGVCEQTLGDNDRALEAWARIPSRSPFAVRVAVPRAQALIVDRGQFSAAEEILKTAIESRDASAIEARQILARLFFWQGRLREMRRLLQDGWPIAPDRAAALREYWQLDTDPIPTVAIQAALDRAAQKAPHDDRAWLARANLATRSGRFDEAATWLDQCETARPDDPAVWERRLDLAVAANHDNEAWRALSHLKIDRVSAAEILALEAWLASRRGLPDRERRALESLVALEPGHSQALERLAALAREAGRTDCAVKCLHEKAAIDVARERYRDLLATGVPAGKLEDLARLAEALGRRFEARGWWTLIVVAHPDNPQFRTALDRQAQASTSSSRPAGQTIAEAFADLAPPTRADGRLAATVASAGALPKFRDDAKAARLSSMVFDSGASALHQMPETASGGVGLFDYDGDGWLDIYFVQGGPFPPGPNRPSPGDRLFRNRGDGTFDDVTTESGVSRLSRGYGHGVAIGDFDNDGHPDLLLTRWREYELLRNRGDGTFEDVTGRAGLGGDRDWPTSAAFADLDGDGDLDLYVCHYVVWDAGNPRPCWDEVSRAHVACFPREFKSLPDHLFRNDGGRFVDVTAEAGIVDRDGRGLGVVAADLDDDGRVDLYVANDTTANFLFHNLGGFRFEETACLAGAGANSDGGYQAGMGVACGDLDGDGRLDLAVTNFFNESTSYFQNLGGGMFADRTAAIGLSAPSRFLLGFGIAMPDVNNDGRLDLMTANGHVSDLRPRSPFAMPAQLLVGGNEGRLNDVSAQAGPPFAISHVGRGLAVGDLDNDGRIDAILIAQNEPPVFFHNQTDGGHFLTLRLEGVKSNRDAVGARVTLVHGNRRQVAERVGGGSYQSAADPRLHFGLGSDDGKASLEVRWPSGRVDRYQGLSPDRGYHLREGDGTARPLAGFGRAATAARPLASIMATANLPSGATPIRASEASTGAPDDRGMVEKEVAVAGRWRRYARGP